MIGQEIKRLEPEHIKRLFGKKVFALEDGKASYVVEINSIFIADTEMRIWLGQPLYARQLKDGVHDRSAL